MILPQDWWFVPGKVALPFISGVYTPAKNDISADEIELSLAAPSMYSVCNTTSVMRMQNIAIIRLFCMSSGMKNGQFSAVSMSIDGNDIVV